MSGLRISPGVGLSLADFEMQLIQECRAQRHPTLSTFQEWLGIEFIMTGSCLQYQKRAALFYHFFDLICMMPIEAR